MVIFVIKLFMIVPLSKDSGCALFVFKVHITHLPLEQSIVAIMYDESRAYFGIFKIAFFTGFCCMICKYKRPDCLARPVNSNRW